MPYKTLKKSKPEYDPEYVQQKIILIEKGLPIDISEEELKTLEEMLKGALSFYTDLLMILDGHQAAGNDIEENFACEARNLAGVTIALRKLSNFRSNHWKNITHVK